MFEVVSDLELDDIVIGKRFLSWMKSQDILNDLLVIAK